MVYKQVDIQVGIQVYKQVGIQVYMVDIQVGMVVDTVDMAGMVDMGYYMMILSLQ